MRHTIGTRFAKAFTIIELLVVISIIGILATIVLAPLSTSRAKGRDARRIAAHLI
jgi:prepilin-type N-terminal cleavage/methylation domain-containing protein